MNIFAISDNPHICAQALDNKRLNKMIVETGQILSTVLRGTSWPIKDALYKSTHVNHPCVRWARESRKNCWWLDELLYKYLSEYEHRFNKEHKTTELFYTLPYVYSNIPELPNIPRTPFPNVTPYKDLPVHEAYKKHLCDKWKTSNPKWTNRTPPEFYI